MQQIEISCYPDQQLCQAQPAAALHFSYPFTLQARIGITNHGQQSCQLSLQLLEKSASQSWQSVHVQISLDQEIIVASSLQTLLTQAIMLRELPASTKHAYLVQFSLDPNMGSLEEQQLPFELSFDWRWQLDCSEAVVQSASLPVISQSQVLAATTGTKLSQSTSFSGQPDSLQSKRVIWLFVGFTLLLLLLFVIMKFIHVAGTKKKPNILD